MDQIAELEKLIKDVTYITGDDLTKICAKIDYKQSYVSSLKNPKFTKGSRPNVIRAIREAYRDELARLPNSNLMLENDKKDIFELRSELEEAGFSPEVPDLNKSQRDSLLLKLSNDVEEVLKYTYRSAAKLEDKTVKEVRDESILSKRKRMSRLLNYLAVLDDEDDL